ncbi:MAG: PolC-type DNA polymerase III [Lachnospira sp.]|nr:PolC-type DNA polymerase III [Lachnospira sp.]
MEDKFLEVFKALNLSKEMKDLLAEVVVEKMVQSSAKNLLRIFIRSERLIHKKDIIKLEELLIAKYFKMYDKVKIIEKFQLSSQYTPKKLWDVYYDSLLVEMENYNKVLYGIMSTSRFEFVEEYSMKMTVADNIIAIEKGQEIADILEKVFYQRCGFNVGVELVVGENIKTKVREKAQFAIKREVEAIAERNETKETVAVTKENKPAKSAEEGNQLFKPKKTATQDADVIYGRRFEDELTPINQIITEIGEVTISGQIRAIDTRPIKNEKTIVIFSITDFTDTISVKLFARNEQLEELMQHLKKGAFIKLKGIAAMDKFDHEVSISSVTGIMKASDNRVVRKDNAMNKRVELHCHTKMSEMDGVADVGELIDTAIAWGHKALAITDHGVVQGFTEAYHHIKDVEKKYKSKDEKLDFKLIYGVEAYLVDDLKDIVTKSAKQSLDDKYVVFDIETTGFSPTNDRIIEIGAVKIENGEEVDRFSTFVNPDIPIPFRIENLTGINDSMVATAPFINEVLPKFLEFCEGCVLVAHNADFDVSFIKSKAKDSNIAYEPTYLDTVALARILMPNLTRYKLDVVAKALAIPPFNHHRAVDDAAVTAQIFVKFIQMLKDRDVFDLDAVNKISALNEEAIKKLPTYHAIILATNEIGRVNLYRLISMSHLKYYHRRPRIPKSELMAHREGLLVGSACEAGELYQAILNGRDEKEITRLVEFYDYLEIQQLGNNKFMLESDKYSINSMEDLKNINRRIVELGDKFNKMVVATCDVHFVKPEDEVYRRIIMAGQGFDDADNQAPLYLHTTDEMLEECAYLGSDKAEEVVITNPNKIADMCEKIAPVRPDKCAPVIENSDETLKNICYSKAHEIYGEELPKVVVERLERELNSIISNGFAVMYIIAQKLVWKSNEDGYLVGSRGSVGSSFAATMAGITEVNPLSPHYYCSKCHYSDFDSEEVRAFSGGAGCDMPDKDCPVCGEKLKKDGFDIPFETFLGFNGDKEPDIDLNFSGEYQAKAHAYTEVIFGKGQTFKAGTIGTLADKTAYGYVKKYYEERNSYKRGAEIERLLEGCTGVKRSTGQHPGGIIVLPIGEEIHSFTPVQHPANDEKSTIITTHFDYHSIDHNLLKLDILGHDDPTMIRMLQDLTGIDPKTIPLDSKEVMSLFKSTEALKIKPEDIGGCKLGALGIPEFGTDFAMQMLIDTKPQYFSDLVRIAGLSHGTDVWLGNAQTLLEEGKATISTAICTRDDIMVYLINKGMDKGESFKIMESVRKGKGLSPEWEEHMVAAGVPDWYIWSCKKIKYMFPKAHAAAYVMMAWRIAYCKVFYPLAYYTAFFSIRAKAFSYEIMCQGRDKLEYFMADYKKRDAEKLLSAKEESTLHDMKIVQEMYARGFEFLPIELEKVQATNFQIIDGKIMPSLNSIDGLGEKAAYAIVEAVKNGPFLSKEDFANRTKVSKTVIELMSNLGILTGLPESSQLSIFDFT